MRGRALDKGRVAIGAPLSLGVHRLDISCPTFCCGFLCGFQFAVSVIFIWLLLQ